MPLDYSKWSHIEISDDEDDTHPNIDTPSLFRWRHKARLERDAEFLKEKEDMERSYKQHLKDLSDCKKKLEVARQSNSKDLDELNTKFEKLSKADKEWEEKNSEFQKKERLKPWNIDSICKEGKSFSAINHVKDDKPVDEEEDADHVVDRMKKFVEKYDKEIKTLGMLQKPIDSKNYLIKNPHLACEDSASHLLLWCIELAIEEKTALMDHVSHQCVMLQFILELAKYKRCDPKAILGLFFTQFVDPQPEYQAGFDAELKAFRERVRARAKVRVEEAVDKFEEEERKKRLGPGGLDPLEVMESLPQELQECFQKRDTELLKQVLTTMPPEVAEAHLKRCIDSGLWVENANEAAEQKEQQDSIAGKDDEATYSKIQNLQLD